MGNLLTLLRNFVFALRYKDEKNNTATTEKKSQIQKTNMEYEKLMEERNRLEKCVEKQDEIIRLLNLKFDKREDEVQRIIHTQKQSIWSLEKQLKSSEEHCEIQKKIITVLQKEIERTSVKRENENNNFLKINNNKSKHKNNNNSIQIPMEC